MQLKTLITLFIMAALGLHYSGAHTVQITKRTGIGYRVSPYIVLRVGDTVRLEGKRKSFTPWYETRWEIFMPDTETVIFADAEMREDVPQEAPFDPIEVVNPANRKLEIRISQKADVTLLGNSSLAFALVHQSNNIDTGFFQLVGAAYLDVLGNFTISTSRFHLNTSEVVTDTSEPSTIFDIADRPIDTSAMVCSYGHWMAFKCNGRSGVIENGQKVICITRVNESVNPDWLPRPSKWDPDTAAFFLDDKTAPELLRELVGYYGLKGYSIGPDIDTTTKGLLCLGYVTKATPIGVWVSELGRMHRKLHFLLADDSIFVSRTPFVDSLNSDNLPYR